MVFFVSTDNEINCRDDKHYWALVLFEFFFLLFLIKTAPGGFGASVSLAGIWLCAVFTLRGSKSLIFKIVNLKSETEDFIFPPSIFFLFTTLERGFRNNEEFNPSLLFTATTTTTTTAAWVAIRTKAMHRRVPPAAFFAEAAEDLQGLAWKRLHWRDLRNTARKDGETPGKHITLLLIRSSLSWSQVY